jgi:uncharacterized cysteine cluster protein YcgN (CxxCxxCC family)
MNLKEWDALCTRCGKCCVLTDGKDCDNLVRLPGGTTRCKIYQTVKRKWKRGIYPRLREGSHCVPVHEGGFNTPLDLSDCPYNQFVNVHEAGGGPQ